MKSESASPAQNIHNLLVFLLILLTFSIHFPVSSQVLVQPERPRIYVDTQRINEIRDATQMKFPEAGSLTLRIYPFALEASVQAECLLETNKNKNFCNYNIVDGYDTERDHLFFRHIDHFSSTDQLKFQVAFQSKVPDSKYVSNYTFSLPKEEWRTIVISWNSTAHTTSVQIIEDGTLLENAWNTVTDVVSGVDIPVEWSPNDQDFVLSGRLLMDDVLLESTPGTLLAAFHMEEGSGFNINDSGGTTYGGGVNTGASWTQDPVDVNNGVLHMDGTSGSVNIFGNALADARVDLSGIASGHVTKLNNGNKAADVKEDQPNQIVDVARSVGLAYLLLETNSTERDSYLDAALEYAKQLIEVEPSAGPAEANNPDYTQSGRVEAMGILYDWLYTELDSTPYPGDPQLRNYSDMLALRIMQTTKLLEKYICGAGNTLHVSQQTDGSLTGSWTCLDPATPSIVGGHDHENDTSILAGILAIATEYPELQDLLDIMEDNFKNGFDKVREWVSIDGGHHMGWDYGAVYTFQDATQLFDVATNVDLKASWQTKLIDRYIYGLRSDLVYPASGDAFKNTRVGLNSQHVAGFSLIASNRDGNAYAQEFYDTTIRPFAQGVRFEELMYWTPGMQTSNISELSTSIWFRNSGQVLMRDNWDYTNASLVEFKSTSFWTENHHHLDQNAFTVYYKAPLLIDSGFYDRYASDHWQNYFTRSVAHNTLTVWDPTEQYVKTSHGPVYSNDGGQQFPEFGNLNPTDVNLIRENGSNHLDGIVDYEYGSDYTYTVGNASKAYIDQKAGTGATKLDSEQGFLRHLVHLKSPGFWPHPIIIDYDTVTTIPGKESLDKSLLWHMVNEPVESNDVTRGPGIHPNLPCSNPLRISNGGGMVLLQTLLPVNCSMTKIGGINGLDDFRFTVRDSESGTYTNYATETTDFHTDVGEWRVEMTATDSNLREHFLSVISIADEDPALAPPESTVIDSPTNTGVLLGNQLSVVFSKPDADSNLLFWQQPAGDNELLVTGLEPVTDYEINQVPLPSGSNLLHMLKKTGASNISSDNGVIRLSSPIGIGEGFITSKNSDFSTVDTQFTETNTLHVLAWTDQIDESDPSNVLAKFTLYVNGVNGPSYKTDLTNNSNKTYTGSIALGPEHVGTVGLVVNIREKGQNSPHYKPEVILLDITMQNGNIMATRINNDRLYMPH